MFAVVEQPVDAGVVGAVQPRQHHARRAREDGVHPVALSRRQRVDGHVARHARAGRLGRRGVRASGRGGGGREAKTRGEPAEGACVVVRGGVWSCVTARGRA